jgi:cytochrome c oxidase subunit 2
MGNLPFFPPQASTVAGQVDLLLLALIGLSAFFSSIVLALIIYFGVRYRRGNAVDRSDPPTTSLRVELGWIFGLLILGLGIYTWAAIQFFNMFRPAENSLDIYVVGLQWMWKFQHLEGNSEINTLHVPQGRPVRLVMTSEDVIHSLYVPAFRLKHDVIPGRYTNLFFEATRPGEYPIFCAEFCGTDHSRMIGRVIVMEQQRYQEWLSGGTGAQVPPASAGEGLFEQLGCTSCHVQGAGQIAPSLEGLFGQEVALADGSTATADENYLRESILDPQAKIVAGFDPIMPTYQGQVSEEQLLQIIAYIRSLDREGGSGTAP